MNIKLSTLFISIIGAIVFITTTNATTMCVTDDMETVTLDPTENGTSSTSNPTKKTWSASFAYGTVSGIATCNEVFGDGYAKPYSGNQGDIQPGTSGSRCWCRMTSPVRSAWVFYYVGGSASGCDSDCVIDCGYGVQSVSAIRGALYNTAGM